MAFDSYLVREEDGTSHFLLEDGSGAIILETAVEISGSSAVAPKRGRSRQTPFGATYVDDEDTVAAILTMI